MKPFVIAAALLSISLTDRRIASAQNSSPTPPPFSFSSEVAKIQEQAKTGDDRALGIVAELRRAGMIKIEKSEALKAAETSAARHNPFGVFAMALIYRTGEGTAKDLTKGQALAKEALPGLLTFANAGDVWAQFEAGIAFNAGYGTEQKVMEATAWYRKAAEQGLPMAQAFLGRCYYIGMGVAKDPDEAFRWAGKAADQGITDGLMLKGHCYLNGIGVTKSAQEAVNWYRKAAEQGAASAQFTLGNCYSLGRGVDKNMAEGAKWYAKAAEQGFAEAQCSLGYLYKNGTGVERNPMLAMKWLRMGALNGSVQSQLLLANAYARGEGVSRDIDEAKRWFFMASNNTDPRNRKLVALAAKALERLKKAAPAVAQATPTPDFLTSTKALQTPVPDSKAVHSSDLVPHPAASDPDLPSGSLQEIIVKPN